MEVARIPTLVSQREVTSRIVISPGDVDYRGRGGTCAPLPNIDDAPMGYRREQRQVEMGEAGAPICHIAAEQSVRQCDLDVDSGRYRDGEYDSDIEFAYSP